VWAWARLRRIKRSRARALRHAELVELVRTGKSDALRLADLPVPRKLRPPPPPISCGCFYKRDMVLQYGENVAVSNYNPRYAADYPHVDVCTEAWVLLTREQHMIPGRPTQSLCYETIAGTIEVHHNPMLHAKANNYTELQAATIARAVRNLRE